MKKLLTYSIVLLAPIFFCNSCNREGLSNQEKEIQPIVGSNDFFVSLSYKKKIDSKSGEAEPEAILDFIQPLFEPAIHYIGAAVMVGSAAACIYEQWD